jgi:hypothetical protein
MHADTVEGVIEQLAGELKVPRAHLARLTFVVPLAVRQREGRTVRRVRDVALFGDGADELSVRRIASWDEKGDSFSVLEASDDRAALAARLGQGASWLEEELSRREAFLAGLVSHGISEMRAVQDAVSAFRKATL